MARSSGLRALGVWMNGERVGQWSLASRGRHEFRYDRTWLESPDARPISLSLPLAPADFAHSGEVVANFFDNLLPDNADIRARLRARYAAASLSAFDLLAEIGRDCVGALQILPADEEPGDVRKTEGRELDEEAVEAILAGVTSPSMGASFSSDSFRISIAGAQEKTALLQQSGRWLEPRGATPTTHILKLPLGKIGAMGADMSASIENEWLCARIAGAFGFDVARCEIGHFGATKALVVERFDRRLSSDGSWILRLPQEDLCQATGTPPDRKYEAEGGPGIAAAMRLLLGARDPFADRRTFMKAQLLFWLLAAPDGHAKNFSVFIERGGRYRLTPLYDIMSAYPVMGHGDHRIPPERLRMAMALEGKNRHYEWGKMRLRHWEGTARACDFGNDIRSAIGESLERAPVALREAAAGLPTGFPDSVATPLFSGLQKALRQLEVEIEKKEM